MEIHEQFEDHYARVIFPKLFFFFLYLLETTCSERSFSQLRALAAPNLAQLLQRTRDFTSLHICISFILYHI